MCDAFVCIDQAGKPYTDRVTRLISASCGGNYIPNRLDRVVGSEQRTCRTTSFEGHLSALVERAGQELRASKIDSKIDSHVARRAAALGRSLKIRKQNSV